MTAAGRWEDHVRFAAVLAGKTTAGSSRQSLQAGRNRQAFSLKLTNQPLGKVIAAIARQVQLEVVWDEGLLDSPVDPRRRLVSCEVVDADLPTLLDEITKSVGVSYRLEQGKLVIVAGGE